ncbi:hypothetical protein [Streptomyces silaceus]|uniref:hypothetical protein n=1 Tax=Streptomyces silaceus TaxID=545123 RepID=UPI000ACFB173|nr:hypothetical protein [Streptomyces silaceus]
MTFDSAHDDPYQGPEDDAAFGDFESFASPEPADGGLGAFGADTAEFASAATVDQGQEDIALWHEQQSADTCAVVGQEFLIDRFTGVDHTEEELVAVAEAHDWYRPGGGTPMDDVGNLLEFYGVPVERTQGESLESLESSLAEGAGVLVAVDSDEILAADAQAQELADVAGIPGQGADHVVQVIGVDRSDPGNLQVILNDPGRPDGAGLAVPERDFLAAWQDSGRFTVTTAATAGGHHA